jgi:ligand-binding sensor domain-containing protein
VNRLIIFIYFFLGSISYAIAQNEIWRQYTIDNGLPSNECHDLIQDSLGYIWIATDRGLSRFDGHDFKNYGIEEGLKDISILKLEKDYNHNIWLSSNSKNFYIYNFFKDEITEFPYNNLISKHTLGDRVVSHFYFDKKENLHFHDNNKGITSISKNGIVTSFKIENSFPIFTFKKIENKYLLIENSKKSHLVLWSKKAEIYISKPKILNNGSYKNAENPVTRKIRIGNNLFDLGGDTLLYTIYTNGYLLSKDSYLGSAPIDDLSDIYRDPQGGIWATYLYKKGVYFYKNAFDLLNQKGIQYLKNESCTSIILDKEESPIVSTLDHGIFYLDRNKSISLLNKITSQKKITKIEWISDSIYAYLVGVDKVYLFKMDGSMNKLIFTANTHIHDLTFDKVNGDLYITDNPISLQYNVISGKSKNIGLSIDLQRGGLKKILFFDKGRKKLLLFGKTFLIQDVHTEEFIFNSISTDKKFEFYTATDYNDGLLLGGKTGLFYYKNNRLDSLFHIHPVFKERINSIAKFNNFYLIGTQGYGLAIWNGQKKCILLNEKKGLLSNNIESIHVTQDKEVFVSTFKGLSKLTKKEGREITIENYSVQHGLPSNEVFEVDSRHDKVLAATGKGIAWLEKNYYDQPLYKPIIEYVEVNKLKFVHGKVDRKLSYIQNNISIFYKSINLAMNGDISYQYRINHKGWQFTRSDFVNFTSIAPGSYTFEVRAANKNGKWSEPTLIEFTINNPWWKSTWFILLNLVTFATAFYYFYSNKLKAFKKEISIKEEIKQLQQSALQAQMNPHFIFNSLTAIQNFIMLNQKEDAMSYLSRFAKLIRQNLNASSSKLITLDNEIDALKNYIELEQVRFNFNFDYIIKLEKGISPENINIPPLLIQPFVENAINHGLKSKVNDGFLEISFALIDNYLQAIVRDNGKGFSLEKDKVKSNDTHKSMGVSITQKRLNFINETSADRYSIQRNSLNPGTEIVVNIQII